MLVRRMYVANQFYEGSRGPCEKSITWCMGDYQPPEGLGRVLGGVAPHAGWVYSGATAAKVYATVLKYAQPATVVFFGAVHRPAADTQPILDGHDAWATPLGEILVDTELSEAVMAEGAGLIAQSPRAHLGEHSIEVQVPFIKKLFPQAMILPISVPHNANAVAAGQCVARAISKGGKPAVVVASTDLTHYGRNYANFAHGRLPGAFHWMKQNDQRMIRLIESLAADDIVAEAQAQGNACGPGAVAAAVAAAKEMGAQSARLLEYATSAQVAGERNADSAVGYAGMVFFAS